MKKEEKEIDKLVKDLTSNEKLSEYPLHREYETGKMNPYDKQDYERERNLDKVAVISLRLLKEQIKINKKQFWTNILLASMAFFSLIVSILTFSSTKEGTSALERTANASETTVKILNESIRVETEFMSLNWYWWLIILFLITIIMFFMWILPKLRDRRKIRLRRK